MLICLEICTACLFIVSCFSGIAKPSLSVTLQFKHPSCCSLPSPPSGSWLPLPDPGSNAGFFLLTGLFLTGGHVTVSVLLQALYLTVLIIQPTDAKWIMKCLWLFVVELNPPGVGELGLLGLRSDVLLINRGQGLKQRDRHRGAVTLLETAVSHQKLGQQQNRANGELTGPQQLRLLRFNGS